jgi:hypothetical protein
VSPGAVTRGNPVAITASVTSPKSSALVDIEIYNSANAKVFQRFWDGQVFNAGQARQFTTTWTVPAGTPRGTYTVKIGLFSTGWGILYGWNNNAAVVQVN